MGNTTQPSGTHIIGAPRQLPPRRTFQVEKKIRIGVIGVGQRIITLLIELFSAHANVVEIVALCDEAEQALNNAKKITGKFLGDNVLYFSNYSEMFDTCKLIDWIMVGSKNYQHYEHCLAAFEANCNIFCEKPIATSIEQCLKIRERWKSSGKKFITGFVLRHSELYQHAYNLIHNDIEDNRKGVFGKIVNIEANEHLHPSHGGYIMRNWRRFKEQAGPHILEKCCHDIDILNMLIKSVPTKVAAFGGLNIFTPENRPKNEDYQLNYCAWDAWELVDPFLAEKTIEDNVAAILSYRNSVIVTFNCVSSSAWAQRRMRINCVGGTIELDLCCGELTSKKIFQETHAKEFEGGTHGGGDPIMIDDFCDVMVNGADPKVSVEEGFISAVICLAIEEARISGTVIDLEQYWKKFDI